MIHLYFKGGIYVNKIQIYEWHERGQQKANTRPFSLRIYFSI